MLLREKISMDRLKENNCSNILVHLDFYNNKYGYFFVYPFVQLKKPPSEFPAVWKFLKDVATAIMGCHSNNILHGDIKPSNILISTLDEVYLCDFETAIEPEVAHPFTGTTCYWSPEVCRCQDDAQNFPRDMWCFGIVIIETVYKTYPFAEIDHYAEKYDNAETLLKSHEDFLSTSRIHSQQIEIPQKWKVFISEENSYLPWPELLEHPFINDQTVHHILLQQLLKRLLTLDPNSRYTIFETLEYIKNVIQTYENK